MLPAGLAAIVTALIPCTQFTLAQATDFDFAAPIVIEFPNDQFPSDLAIGDLNGNGHKDLVVPGRNSDGIIYVLLANGDGTFATPQPFEIGVGTDEAVLADFNGDGHLDLALAIRSTIGRVAVLFGNGDGTFSEEPHFYFVGRLTQNLVAGDLNGNGHIDLVAGSERSGTIRALLNNGDGTFAVQEPIIIDEFVTGQINVADIAIGDVTGNGAPDLVVTTLGTSRMSILINDGTGQFTIDRAYQRPMVGEVATTGRGAVVADLNGNGANEVITPMAIAANSPDRATIYLDGMNGVFDPPLSFPMTTGGLIWSIAVADFDGDGRPDLVANSVFSYNFSFVRNISEPGQLAFTSPMTISDIASFPRRMYTLDVNGNGALDLIYADIFANSVHIRLNLTPQAGSAQRADGRRGDDGDAAAGSTEQAVTPQGDFDHPLSRRLGINETDSVRDMLRKLDSLGDSP
jgi:hypothetical protein